MSFDVCVIGAGLTGLSAALNVQKLIPRVKVTIIADDYGRRTTTPVTSGLFIPAPFNLQDLEEEQARECLSEGWSHHLSLATSEEAGPSGHSFITGSSYWWHKGLHVLPHLVLNYREKTHEEMDNDEIYYTKQKSWQAAGRIGENGRPDVSRTQEELSAKKGCEFTTVHVDLKLYLPWLMKKVRERGVTYIYDRVFSFHELYGQYDVIINCVGKRCRELFNDFDLSHAKGNLLKVEAPSIDTFLVTQDQVSIVPSPQEGICDVGVLWEPGQHVQGVTEDSSWLVMHRASRLEPRLTGCRVVETYSEKRPIRTPMLIKMHAVDCGGPLLPVVHNVGHGMDTVTVAWGAGCYVAHLVQECQRQTKPFARVCQPFGTLA